MPAAVVGLTRTVRCSADPTRWGQVDATTAKPAMAWEIFAVPRTWLMAASPLSRMAARFESMPRRTAATDTSRCADWISAAFRGASEAAQSAVRRVIPDWRRAVSRRVRSANSAISAAMAPSASRETEEIIARLPAVLGWAPRVRQRLPRIVAATARTACPPMQAGTHARAVRPMEAAPALRTEALATEEWDAARRSAARERARLPPRVSR